MFRAVSDLLKKLLHPHVIFILVSLVFLFVPTPLEYISIPSNFFHRLTKLYTTTDTSKTIENTPFVFIPEPGKFTD